MPRALKISLAILAGYAAGALLGYLLFEALSPNRHDRALEAVMTAFSLWLRSEPPLGPLGDLSSGGVGTRIEEAVLCATGLALR